MIDRYLNIGYDLAIAPNNTNVIYAGGSNNTGSEYVMAVCYSNNGGSSWNRVELSTSQGYIYDIAIHPNNADIAIVGGYCFNGTSYVGKIFKTVDGGANWSDISQSIGDNNNNIYCLAFDPQTPTTLYAGAIRGIYKSTDSGKNWVNVNDFCYNVYALAIHPHTSVIYAASYGLGVYFSENAGTNWTAMNEGLTSFELECMILDSKNNLLFVGTSSEGVFRYDVSTTIEPVVTESLLPTELRLSPNFPNPFNPKTRICYEVPNNLNSPIRLRIYNVAGQLIKSLVDDIQPGGSHTAFWDGSDDCGILVPSGVYFCVLQAGNFSVSRKMTLIR